MTSVREDGAKVEYFTVNRWFEWWGNREKSLPEGMRGRHSNLHPVAQSPRFLQNSMELVWRTQAVLLGITQQPNHS